MRTIDEGELDRLAGKLRLYAAGMRSDAVRRGWGRDDAFADLLDQAARALSAEKAAREEAERERDDLQRWHDASIQQHMKDSAAAAALVAETTRLRERVKEMEGDKGRLDFLDRLNASLNGDYGTSYGWKMVINHNVNRLFVGDLLIDLHDSEGGISKLPSCRAAIDERMREFEGRRAAAIRSRENSNE